METANRFHFHFHFTFHVKRNFTFPSGALFDLGYYLASGGRRRRCRGGGELPVANTRLTVQDGGSRPRPCSGVSLGSPLMLCLVVARYRERATTTNVP